MSCLMKITIKKKSIPLLVFILSIASIIRLLKIAIITTSSSSPSPPPPTLQHECLSPSPSCAKNSSNGHAYGADDESFPFLSDRSNLTEKEMKFLSDLISARTPCNLLVFGFGIQYLTTIAALNEGGNTVFLEHNLDQKLLAIRDKMIKISNDSNTRVYKLEYNTVARDAYKLLKHARKNQDCSPTHDLFHKSRCKLALTKLPHEVYDLKWDIVVVDGPCGDRPHCPGRMAAIYTASVLARKGNMTHVVVHDIDRLIEKWFSWEFLCEKNLVSAKGKFWNFRIVGESNSTTFCPV